MDNPNISANNLLNILRTPGRYIPDGDQNPLANRKENIIFKTGIVMAVDERKQEIFIQIENDGGYALNIPITQPFSGTNSYIAGMPDEGSIVVLGYLESQNKYFPLSYIPNYYAALDGKAVQLWDDKSIKNAGINDYFYRFRQLSKGEVAIASSKGPELYLNDSVNLTSGLGDDFLIKRHAFISTSFNNYEFTTGVWKNSGVIYRNLVKNIDDNIIFKEPSSIGKDSYSLKANRLSGKAAEFYTEYLIEVSDRALKFSPKNDVNSDSGRIEKRSPIAIFSLGNFVGNNSEKTGTYAKNLGISLFVDRNDFDGNFRLYPIAEEDIDVKSMAISFYSPDRRDYEKGAFFGINKEGKFYQYIPGTGVSSEVLSRGSKKEVWDVDEYGNSMDITLKGGLRLKVGKHNKKDPLLADKSLDLSLDGNVSFLYGKNLDSTLYDIYDDKKIITDVYSYNLIHKVEDKERYEVLGTREKRVGGKEIIVVEGIKEETIGADYNLLVTSGMKHNVTDTYTINVSKEKSENLGSSKITITGGKKEVIMNTISSPATDASIIETIMIRGNREFSTNFGNIKEKILKIGSRIFSTEIGNVSFDIKKSGSITLKTKSNSITIKTKAGSMSLESSAQLTAKTKAQAKIEGSLIDLKGKGGMGGIITSKTHKDYITGAFLVGSKTVRASGNIGG